MCSGSLSKYFRIFDEAHRYNTGELAVGWHSHHIA
jgi:hypothetical protein